MQEIWKPIKGFEGLYDVSNLGNIKSLIKGILLKPSNHQKGYLVVNLVKDKKHYHYYVHRIVANAFLENKGSYNTVNHIDGNKKNNCVSNLEWCSDEENTMHAYMSGLRKMSVITEVNMFSKDGILIRKFQSISEASRKTGINMGNISRCVNGGCKTAGGYIWEKANAT